MILPAFRLHRPSTIEEALFIAGNCGNDFDFLAGGTDLVPNYKNRLNPRGNVISLGRVRGLAAPFQRADGGFVIGAMARLADLEESEEVRRRLPGLVEGISQIATPLVRRSATLGGNLLVETRCFYFNQSYDWRASKGFCMKADGDVCLVVPQKDICYAIYAGDTAPILMTLGASFVISGYEGERTIPASEFYRPDGIRKNVLARGQILTEIRLPAEASLARCGYMKLRLRDSFDFPDMGVAAALWLEEGRVADLRIAVTAVSMTPVLFPEVTEPARGALISRDLVQALASDIMGRCVPVKNVMFPPSYRKRMVGVFTRRLLSRLAELP
jgi:4-hydroxybenzoyl-CoA reductase subunit beta